MFYRTLELSSFLAKCKASEAMHQIILDYLSFVLPLLEHPGTVGSVCVRGGFIATPFSNASSYHVRLDKNVATPHMCARAEFAC